MVHTSSLVGDTNTVLGEDSDGMELSALVEYRKSTWTDLFTVGETESDALGKSGPSLVS